MLNEPAAPGSTPDTVVVTAQLTPRQATAVLRSVPWRRRALVNWAGGTLVGSLVAAPLLVAVTGRVTIGLLFVLLLAVLNGVGSARTPWTRPQRRPEAHGIGNPVTWTFSAAGLAVTSVIGHGFRPWSAVDAVEPHDDLLLVSYRRHRWANGIPLAAFPPGAVGVVVTWHTARAPAEPTGPVEPVARREGADLVVVARPSAAQVREPLLTWARSLHRDPARLVLVSAPLVVLAWAASSGGVRAWAGWLGFAGLVLAAAVLEGAVRVQTRTARRHGWRVSAHGVAVAVEAAWHHVPWARVGRVTVTPSFLVATCRDFRAGVVVPIAGFGPDAVADVAGWCRAAGVPLVDRAPGPR